MKLWAIKPRLWPQIEFFSSRGQESRCLSWFSNNLSHPSIHPSSIHPPTPFPYPLATTNPLSFFVDVPVWDISYKWNHVLCVLLCLLLSLSIVCSRSIHTVACVRALLLFMAESYSTVWMDPTVCICLIAYWWLFGWFPLLAVGNWAAVNMCAQVFGFIRKSGIAGSCGDSKFDILRNCQTVFQNGSTISPFPPVLVEGWNFSPYCCLTNTGTNLYL